MGSYMTKPSTRDSMLNLDLDKIDENDFGNVKPALPELSEAEKRKIYDRALASVVEELKAEEEARLLEDYKVLARRSLIPEEEMVPLLVDLAGHAANITLDGTQYFHGVTYHVPRRVYDSLRDIAHQTWRHEREIGGANGNAYRKPRNMTLGPSDAHASLSHLMRI